MTQVLLEDTRNKPGKHKLKNEYWKSHEINVIRTKLYVGDYMLPGGLVSVDTKADMYELASNLKQQHDRFREECVRAQTAGYRLVILVENEDGVSDLYDLAEWIESRSHYAARIRKSQGKVKKRYTGTALFKTCKTMTVKYGVEFEFCEPSKAGARVLEILMEGNHGRDDA